jgi:hypothetical protein
VKPIVARAPEALATLMLSLVVGSVLTLWLLPLWRWIEAATGIGSIGHCGPAGWCDLATCAVLLACWALVRVWRMRRDEGR